MAWRLQGLRWAGELQFLPPLFSQWTSRTWLFFGPLIVCVIGGSRASVSFAGGVPVRKCSCSIFYLGFTSRVFILPLKVIILFELLSMWTLNDRFATWVWRTSVSNICSVTAGWIRCCGMSLLENRKLADFFKVVQVCDIIRHWQTEIFPSFCDVTIPSHLVWKREAEEYSMKPWLREDTGPKLVWHPQPLMNGTPLSVLWAPILSLKRDCFWTGAEPKQTREHQPRPTPDGYTLNAPVVRNNPLCHTPPPAAAQHGAYTQYAVAQDRAGNTSWNTWWNHWGARIIGRERLSKTTTNEIKGAIG